MLNPKRGIGPRLLPAFVLVSGLFSTGAAQNPPGEASQSSATGWKINFDESGSSPVIADGVIYMGSADGGVYALDPKTGQTRWRFQTGKKVDMTPSVENGTVFVGSGDRSFYAIDAATGKKKWSYEAGSGMASAVLKNGIVYFATEDGLHAVDALTGKRKWLFETLQEVPADVVSRKRPPNGPVLGGGVIFLTAWPFYRRVDASKKSFLYAIDPESGKAKWVTGLDHGIYISAPLVAKGLVFFSVAEDTLARSFVSRTGIQSDKGGDAKTTLYAIDATSGRTKWTFDAPMRFAIGQHLVVAGNTICLATDKGLFALEFETGRQLWSFSNDGFSVVRTDDQYVYSATGASLHALALATGQEKWLQGLSPNTGGIVMVDGGVIYVGGNHLQAIDAATGKKLWFFNEAGHARLISGGRIFLTSPTAFHVETKRVDQGSLYAIDAKTGELKP